MHLSKLSLAVLSMAILILISCSKPKEQSTTQKKVCNTEWVGIKDSFNSGVHHRILNLSHIDKSSGAIFEQYRLDSTFLPIYDQKAVIVGDIYYIAINSRIICTDLTPRVVKTIDVSKSLHHLDYNQSTKIFFAVEYENSTVNGQSNWLVSFTISNYTINNFKRISVIPVLTPSLTINQNNGDIYVDCQYYNKGWNIKQTIYRYSNNTWDSVQVNGSRVLGLRYNENDNKLYGFKDDNTIVKLDPVTGDAENCMTIPYLVNYEFGGVMLDPCNNQYIISSEHYTGPFFIVCDLNNNTFLETRLSYHYKGLAARKNTLL